jgi:hypothetical protein
VYIKVDKEDIYTRNYYNPTGNPDATHFESANAAISRDDFLNLSVPGFRGWFKDSTINVSFDILERAIKCEEHHIALLATDVAYTLYRISRLKT